MKQPDLNNLQLSQLGWRAFFQQQMDLEEWESSKPARVVEQHRDRLQVCAEMMHFSLPILPNMPVLTVGDWILLDNENRFSRALERQSVFSRKAAGSQLDQQLIAANIDTLFIVTSYNQDFNLNRIERYLSLAYAAEVEPVIVISKQDLVSDPAPIENELSNLTSSPQWVGVNALSPETREQLSPWLRPGQTIALVGSSGVGKSSLLNSLSGLEQQATATIREDDDKGKHTTTGRSLHHLPGDIWLMDTPGMRELQLVDVEQGIELAFEAISKLAETCRFNDCSHQQEPGCAIQAAIERGELSQARLDNYQKLQREQANNSATLAQKRAKDKALGQMYKRVLSESQRIKRKGR